MISRWAFRSGSAAPQWAHGECRSPRSFSSGSDELYLSCRGSPNARDALPRGISRGSTWRLMRGGVAVQVPKVDPNRCGPDVRQGVNNRIAGSGTALCNTNVLQDRMYFEVKIINPDGASL